jgi:hypothetical protein
MVGVGLMIRQCWRDFAWGITRFERAPDHRHLLEGSARWPRHFEHHQDRLQIDQPSKSMRVRASGQGGSTGIWPES